MARIVNTDNFGGDYPDEYFLQGRTDPIELPAGQAKEVAASLNQDAGELSLRYWKVVEDGYTLQPGFEP